MSSNTDSPHHSHQSGDSTNHSQNEDEENKMDTQRDNDDDDDEEKELGEQPKAKASNRKRKLMKVRESGSEKEDSDSNAEKSENDENSSASDKEESGSEDSDQERPFSVQREDSSFYNKHNNKDNDEDDRRQSDTIMRKYKLTNIAHGAKKKKQKRNSFIEDECEESEDGKSEGEEEEEGDDEQRRTSDDEFITDSPGYEKHSKHRGRKLAKSEKKEKSSSNNKKSVSKLDSIRAKDKIARRMNQRENSESNTSSTPPRCDVTQQSQQHLSLSVDEDKVAQFASSKKIKLSSTFNNTSDEFSRPSKFGFASILTPSPTGQSRPRLITNHETPPQTQLKPKQPPQKSTSAPQKNEKKSTQETTQAQSKPPKPTQSNEASESKAIPKTPSSPTKSKQTTLPTKSSERYYKIGERFSSKQKEYIVTHRGSDSVFERNDESKASLALDKCTVNMYSTCEVIEDPSSTDTKYFLFLLKKFERPYALSLAEANKIDSRHFKGEAEKKKRFVQAKEVDNLEVKRLRTSTTPSICRLIMHPEVYDKMTEKEKHTKNLSGQAKSYGKESSSVMALFINEFMERTPHNIHTVLTRNAKKWKECDAVPLEERGNATIAMFGSELLEQIISFIILADVGGKFRKFLPPNPIKEKKEETS